LAAAMGVDRDCIDCRRFGWCRRRVFSGGGDETPKLDRVALSRCVERRSPSAPEGEALDFNLVNVQFSVDGASEVLPYVEIPANCGVTQGGWYYDKDPLIDDVPTKIVVCPSTCDAFQQATGGEVEIALGCETVTTVVK
jgi:hypothetical protein